MPTPKVRSIAEKGSAGVPPAPVANGRQTPSEELFSFALLVRPFASGRGEGSHPFAASLPCFDTRPAPRAATRAWTLHACPGGWWRRERVVLQARGGSKSLHDKKGGDRKDEQLFFPPLVAH